MKSIDRFLGITALVLAVLLIAAIVGGSVYVSRNKDFLNDFGNFNFFEGENFNMNFSFDGKRSSTFETLKTSKSDNFPLAKSLVIDVAVNDITFVQEDRSDIMVVYHNEHPDTPLYDVSYNAEFTESTLYINSSYSVSNLFIDKTYENTITIHVPNTYTCESLDLTMSMGEITDESIFDGAKNINLHAKLGRIDLEITSPLDTLSVTCDMGDIDLVLSAPIETFDAKSNFGQINLKINDRIGSLWCDLDMGSLTILSNNPIDKVSMTAKMGSIDCTFKERIGKLNADANMGSIDVDFGNNDDSTVYVDANAGSIDSDLPVVKESADPEFRFYANMGSINITSH